MVNCNDLIVVENLSKHFPINRGFIFRSQVGKVQAVNNVSFTIRKGETLGLVGESGCGKSTLGRTIIQLYPATAGKVFYQSVELNKVKGKELRKIRRNMQIIFQDPFSSLNPRMSVGRIIREPLDIHNIATMKERMERVKELLVLVGLNPSFVGRYPHEFSGGQRQRIGIARALALEPEFIVCDEPISALDVSIQAQVVNLLRELQQMLNLTYLFIAHDLSMVKYISDRIAVMYLGQIVELATRDDLFANPLHPYTKALFSAVPIPNPVRERNLKRPILVGDIPNPSKPPGGCRFHTRCPIAMDLCKNREPEWRDLSGGHWVACHAVQ